MKTCDFNYVLPKELIAQHPHQKRDQARMLVINRKEQSITHQSIKDISNYITSLDALVLNNTKVMHSRLFGKKESGGKIEVLFLEELDRNVWSVLIKSSRRPHIGVPFFLGKENLAAEIISEGEQGSAIIKISSDILFKLFELEGLPPLPPYISRKNTDTEILKQDKIRYQTVYASELGAAAAPTAGLHFTPEILNGLRKKGISITELTLHVGLGTFRPVSSENIHEHTMHTERYHISHSSACSLNKTKENNGRIFAVGSTSVRTLESLPILKERSGSTDLFIYPPYSFKFVDAILTNFHLPKSSLLMMMAAFTGKNLLMDAYHEAIKEHYKFFSYGDCMLIL